MTDPRALTLEDLVSLGAIEGETEELALGPLAAGPLARVCVADNPFEAELLRGALEAEGIPTLVECYREIAYDGLFQAARGWGGLVVREADAERAAALIDELRPGLGDPSEE